MVLLRRKWRPLEPSTGLLVTVCNRSPWPAASVWAFALMCALDLAIAPLKLRGQFVAYLVALGLVVALINGVCWSFAWFFLKRFGGRFAPLFWPIIGLTAGGWLAHDLGAFTKFQGRYRMLAIGVLAACAVGGFALGLLCAAFQPTVRRPVGFVLARRGAIRLIVVCLLAAAVYGLQVVDRRYYLGQYRDAHIALRLAGVWCAMAAWVTAERYLPLFRMTALRWVLVLAGFVLCLITLDESRYATLQSFDARAWPAGILRVSRALVDWDFDGYAPLLGGGDCAPLNPRVHPGAREIPDNGIDDNCILGDAKRKTVRFETLPIPKEPSALDVVLITVDALRPDHLGVYNPLGYGPKGRATSPNLDRWAANATVFNNAYSPGGWTSVVMPSLLRGVYARRLRWTKYFETNLSALIRKPFQSKLRPGEQVERMFPMALDDPHPPIAALLRHRGMYTMAVTDDGYGAMLQRGTGIEAGFDLFREVDDLIAPLRNDAGTATEAIRVLSHVPRGRRFFLWVHFFGTHWPPEFHPGIRVYGDNMIDQYDHEVAFFDSQVVRLLDALAKRPHPTAIFIAADHGEGLTPEWRQHGLTLEDAVIRIAFIARVPGWPAVRISTPVSLIDIMPTFLALTGSSRPAFLDGLNLTDVVRSTAPARVLFSDTWRFDANEAVEIDQVAGYNQTSKVIFDRLSGNLYRIDDLARSSVPRFLGKRPVDDLSRIVYGYIEETGGTLDLSD